MADKEKKVFDVAKPGDSKPDIGSKPMIVGHKSVASDPMVKKNETEKTTDETETANGKKEDVKPEPNRTVKKRIAPLTGKDTADVKAPKTEDKKADNNTKTEPAQNEKKASVVADEKKPENPKDSDKTESNQEKKKDEKLDPAAIAMEQEENLQKIVQSKKYFVDINEKKSGSARTFLVVFFGLVALGFVVLFVLIDTGTLNVDYDLPFRIFNG